MTGLLVLENASFDEVVTVSQEAADTGGQEIGLVAGEQFTVGALFRALMVRSANDAASALAEHVAGSVPEFVDLMNQRADELGLENTSFANPHGMDASGHYSSARDLLTLARLAMEHPEFAEVVRARAMVLPDDPEGSPRVGISTNLMLSSYEGMLGVKTGLTPQALFTFVGAAEREGRRLYAVVLGSPENFGHFIDARALLDYGFRDLGFYGDALTGSEYEASMARVDPDHLVTMSQVETYLHLAGQGLMLEHPAPLVETSPTGATTDRGGEPRAAGNGDVGGGRVHVLAAPSHRRMTATLPAVEALLEADIQSRVVELGDAIAADYEGRVPIFVVVMMGSVPFAADLIRRVGIESEIDFLVLNRFGEGGRIGIAMDLWTPVIDRDVVIVEDITDTGLTLSVLRKTILDRGASSVATASLIDKTRRRVTEVPIEYRGFEVGDEYLVGYGMDWQGYYRNLRSIWAVLDMEAFVNDPRVLFAAV